MFSRFKRTPRVPHRIYISEAERPIRLDEQRLQAWAFVLEQGHRTERPGLIARLLRRLLRSGVTDAEASGASSRVDPALGESLRKPYVWRVEAESDSSDTDKRKPNGRKPNGSRAA